MMQRKSVILRFQVLLYAIREVEVWDFETGTGRVDDELTQAMTLVREETFIVGVNEPAACSSTSN